MEHGGKAVLVLCDKASRELALQITEQLEADEIARSINRRNAVSEEYETAGIWMDAQADIAMSAAVIFITEDAVNSDEWQDEVNAVPAEYRRIPVCLPGDIDMKKIPKSLEEINFIPADEHLYDNIKDSLMTDPAFYSEKNLLQIRWGQWVRSGIDGNLLTDRKIISAYEQDFSAKLAQERDPYFRQQLENILEYLHESWKYSRRIRLSAAARWFFRAALAVLAVIVVVKALPEYDRASKYNLKLFESSDMYSSVSEALLTTEIATNKYESADTLYDAYLNLIESVNEPWPQSPLGLNYRYRIMDVSMPEGRRFVWSSTDIGRVVIWDTYSGEEAERIQVTDKAIPVIAASEDGTAALAADEDGMLYVYSNGNWNGTGTATSLDVAQADCEVRGSLALLSDGTSYELYRLGTSSVSLQKKESFVRLCAACLSSAGDPCFAAMRSGDKLTVRAAFCGESDVELKGDGILLCDMNEEQLVCCTASGKVFSMNSEGTLRELPVTLKEPAALKVIDARTILYSDAGAGTHLFDTVSVFDYGEFFRKREKINGVWEERGTAVFDNGVYLAPFDLKEIVPVAGSEKEDGGTVFSGRQSSADSGSIRKVSITSKGAVVAEGIFQGEDINIVLDPAKFIFNETGYRENTYWEEIPEDYKIYESVPGLLDGVPVTVGLRFVPGGEINNTDFSYILIGMDNGCFNEIGIDNTNGGCYVTAVYTAPSHAEIISIQQIPSGYILYDAGGRGWTVRSGVHSESRNGMFALVRDKLKCGVAKYMIRMVSKETAQELELAVCPGADGEEWG